jgi:hypothetical protein
MYLEDRQEQEQKIMNDENDNDNEDEGSEDDKEDDSKKDDENCEDEDEANEEEEAEQQPPRKITRNVNGGKRNYLYRTTLKSMEELEEFRYKVIKKII